MFNVFTSIIGFLLLVDFLIFVEKKHIVGRSCSLYREIFRFIYVGYSATALAITTLLGGFVIASEKVEVKSF